MRFRAVKLIFAIFFTFLLLLPAKVLVNAQNCDSSCSTNDLSCINSRITDCENKVKTLRSQADTLSNQIAQYDAQIKLTILKIAQTQEKIDQLSGRINQLETSLGALTKAFSVRAAETYKMARLDEPFFYIVSAPDITSAVSRFYYLRKIQESDRDLMLRLQNAQTNYQEQELQQQTLHGELESQKKDLDSQKKVKATLLAVTRNDEKRFQQLLAQARAELEAIQAILAGKGTEEEVGKVGVGQRIATIIQGPSCNSSGSHLHFMVAQGTNTSNPFSYLKSISAENCSGSSCGSSDQDPFNPSGSWDWPINSPVKFIQGYGSTWSVKNTWVGRIYSMHNGIDINNEGNAEVKAVRAGTLFRGSYSGISGCHLRYVRVDHDEGDLETYYLHVNY